MRDEYKTDFISYIYYLYLRLKILKNNKNKKIENILFLQIKYTKLRK
jgi:hypothetical protein